MKGKIVIGIIIAFVVVIIIGAVRNGTNNKEPSSENEVVTNEETTALPSSEPEVVVEAPIEDYAETEDDKNVQYEISLGLEADKNKDGRIEVEEPEPTPTPDKSRKVQTKPTYETVVNIFDHTVVPKRNVDGSSCKAYLNSVTLDNFGTYWGTSLTKKDFIGGKLYCVGVEQNPKDTIKGVDLQSTGWLINHLSKMKASDVVKFTNLHVIGSLSASHVALLCSYDWYSAFGLKDTLVVFEDISNTLKLKDFKDGDIFSAIAFAHNIKVMKVNGFNVVVVEYNTFNNK